MACAEQAGVYLKNSLMASVVYEIEVLKLKKIS
jgi:hypothetical protein